MNKYFYRKLTHTLPGSSFLWYSTMSICLDLGTITQRIWTTWESEIGGSQFKKCKSLWMNSWTKMSFAFPKILIHLRLVAKNMLPVHVQKLPLLRLSGTLFFGAELACGSGFSCSRTFGETSIFCPCWSVPTLTTEDHQLLRLVCETHGVSL